MSGLVHELRQAFVDAVHDLSAAPTQENIERYLLASRELERPAESDASVAETLAA